jgi:formylglycine-generating enzyme required for sulfatase activity
MACIPGGWFLRGTDDGPKDTRPAAKVWLQTFYMDVYEVTNRRWEACQKAGECGYGKPYYNDYSRPEQPIVGVSWYAAVQYCEAKGGHLPTEAEWEKAARGPGGALHPWGDEPATCERAVIRDATGRSCGTPKAKGRGAPEKGRTFVVGTRPAGVYGLHDMSGNSWEWVADWYTKSYAACGEDCLGEDPRGPCGGKEPCKRYRRRIVRGGSWYWVASYATSVWRRYHVPGNKPFHHFGFRCAASAEEAGSMVGAP